MMRSLLLAAALVVAATSARYTIAPDSTILDSTRPSWRVQSAYDAVEDVYYFTTSQFPPPVPHTPTVYTATSDGAGNLEIVRESAVAPNGPQTTSISSLVFDNARRSLYLGFSTFRGEGSVSRVNVNTMLVESSVSVNGSVTAMDVDPHRDQLFVGVEFVVGFGRSEQDMYLVKGHNAAGQLEVLSSLRFPDSYGQPAVVRYDRKRESCYVGTRGTIENGFVGKIVLVDVNTDASIVTSFRPWEVRRDNVLEPAAQTQEWSVGFVDYDQDVAYFGAGGPTARIVKIDLDTFTVVDQFVPPACTGFAWAVQAPGRSLLFGTTGVPSRIYVMDRCDFSFVELLTSTSTAEAAGAVVGPKQVLFFDDVSRVNSMSTNDLSTCAAPHVFEVLARRRASCLTDVRTAMYDAQTNSAFFATASQPSKLVRVDLSTDHLDVVTERPLRLPASFVTTSAISSRTRHGYLGTDTQPSEIVKVDLDRLEPTASVRSLHGIKAMVLDDARDELYVATAPRVPNSAAAVIKFNANTLDVINAVDIDIRYGNASSLLFDAFRSSIYVGTDASPARVLRFDSRTFAPTGVIELAFDSANLASAIMDSTHSYALFGSRHTSFIAKIDLQHFRCVDTQSVEGVSGWSTAVDDPSRGYSYWIPNDVPSSVHRMRMCDCTWEEEFPLRYDEQVPRVAFTSSVSGLVLSTGCELEDNTFCDECGYLMQLRGQDCSECAAGHDDFERVTTTTLNNPVRDVRTGVISTRTDTAYFASFSVPSYAFPVDWTTGIAHTERRIEVGSEVVSSAIDEKRRFAYFGSTTAPGEVSKVDLSTWQVVGAVDTAGAVRALAFDEKDNVIYAAANPHDGSVAMVHKIDAESLDVLATTKLHPTDGGILTMQHDNSRGGGFLYVGTDTAPARIVLLRTCRMERINYLEMPHGWDEAAASLMDKEKEFVYFSILFPHARLIKIALNSFRHISTLDIPALPQHPMRPMGFLSGAEDPARGFQYWFSSEIPSTVHRIRSCNFTYYDAWPLRVADQVPQVAMVHRNTLGAVTSCQRASDLGSCPQDSRSVLFQLETGGRGICLGDHSVPVRPVVIPDTLVSVRFNFGGMLPQVPCCQKKIEHFIHPENDPARYRDTELDKIERRQRWFPPPPVTDDDAAAAAGP